MGFFDRLFGRGSAPAFVPGAAVVVRGRGLGTITHEETRGGATFLVVKVGHGSLSVPSDRASLLLEPLPTRERAVGMKAELLRPVSPDARPASVWMPEALTLLQRGTPEERLALAARVLAGGAPASFGERRLREQLTDQVLAPIAAALAQDVDGLVAEIGAHQAEHRAEPRVPSSRSQPRAEVAPAEDRSDAPRAPDAAYLGTLQIVARAGGTMGELVVGDPAFLASEERTQHGELSRYRVEVPAGSWHAYVGDDGEWLHLTLVHRGASLTPSDAQHVATVAVEGGSIAIFDLDAATEAGIAAVWQHSRGAGAAHRRGCAASTGGDGGVPVSVARDAAGAVVYVCAGTRHLE